MGGRISWPHFSLEIGSLYTYEEIERSSYLLDSVCRIGVVMHDPLHCVRVYLINRVVARHKPFSYVLSAMTQYIVLGERGSVSLEPP